MVKIPHNYPAYLTPLVQDFIQTKKYNKDYIELMVEQFEILKKRITVIKIQGDKPNEWWDPNSIQAEVINSVIFEVIGPYLTKGHLTFYSDEKHGPYISSGHIYTVYLGHDFPNCTLCCEHGKKRNVKIFILPEHEGAKFPI